MVKYLVILFAMLLLISCTEKPSKPCQVFLGFVPTASFFVAPLAGCDSTKLAKLIIDTGDGLFCKDYKQVASVTQGITEMGERSAATNTALLGIMRGVCRTLINTMVALGKTKLVTEASCNADMIDGLLGGDPTVICMKITF